MVKDKGPPRSPADSSSGPDSQEKEEEKPKPKKKKTTEGQIRHRRIELTSGKNLNNIKKVFGFMAVLASKEGSNPRLVRAILRDGPTQLLLRTLDDVIYSLIVNTSLFDLTPKARKMMTQNRALLEKLAGKTESNEEKRRILESDGPKLMPVLLPHVLSYLQPHLSSSASINNHDADA